MTKIICDVTYEIRGVMEHYEVYLNGEFICSTDTIAEAVKEVEKLRKEEDQE